MEKSKYTIIENITTKMNMKISNKARNNYFFLLKSSIGIEVKMLIPTRLKRIKIK